MRLTPKDDDDDDDDNNLSKSQRHRLSFAHLIESFCTRKDHVTSECLKRALLYIRKMGSFNFLLAMDAFNFN